VRTSESVKGSCKWKRVPWPGRDANTAEHLLDHVLHDVQSHAATGDFRDNGFHRKAGQEHELQQFGFRHFGGGFSIGQLLLDNRSAQRFQADARAVI